MIAFPTVSLLLAGVVLDSPGLVVCAGLSLLLGLLADVLDVEPDSSASEGEEVQS